jgi:hypothetical protein
MLQALSLQLDGQPFTPDAVLGHTTGRTLTTGDKPKVEYTPGTGIASQLILQEFPFERACMNCKDAEDKGKTGFVSLSSELPLDGAHTFWAIFFDLLLFGALIVGLHFVRVTTWNKKPVTRRFSGLNLYPFSSPLRPDHLIDQSPHKQKKGKTHA